MIEGILSVLNPISITTGAMLISSTAAEPSVGLALYDPLHSYALYDKCISAVTHRVYKSQSAANTGNDPTDVNNRTGTPFWWSDDGPSNRYKMFDGQSDSQTVVTSPLTIVLRPGFFNAVYLGNLSSELIDVVVRDAPLGNIIFNYSGVLENSQPADWYEYFFSPFRPQRDYLISGLDPYNLAEITITLSSPLDLVKCGLFAIGDLQPLGQTLRGVEVEPITYSYINTDSFGVTNITRRARAKNMVVKGYLELVEASYVADVLSETQDVPCLWVASAGTNYSPARVFGLGKGKITLDTPSPNICTVDITVKGFI